MIDQKLKIGVIFGGLSLEREVSLAGGRNVYHNLDRSKFIPLAIYWDQNARFWEIPESLVIRNTCKEIEDHLEEKGGQKLCYEDLKEVIDLAFLATHGKYGDDGCLQGLLELLGIPYTGSGVLAAALGMDKSSQRKFMEAYGKINLPEYEVVSRWQWQKTKPRVIKNIEKRFGYPLVTKPTREGSTFGVSVAKTKDDLDKAVNLAFDFDNEVLIEKYLRGREFSCIVVGNEEIVAFQPTETQHQKEIFTYDDKYLPGASKKITPIDVEEKILKEIQKQAVNAFKALGCQGYARIDGFVTTDNKVLITDPNSAASTGMGPSSWTWHQAAAAGYGVSSFITKLIKLAKEAHEKKRGPL